MARELRFRPPMRLPEGSSARHNPRGVGQPFSPGIAGDQVNGQRVREDLERNGIVPIDRVIDRLDAYNLPPQYVQASFIQQIAAFGVAGAVRLIPKNPRRWSFYVSNFIGANLMMFAFDKPMDVGGGVGAGLPIGGYYQESYGVSINDIYVFCNDPVEAYPIWVLGYEGGISIAGNRR